MRERARKGAEATARRLRTEGLGPDRLGPLESVRDAQRWLRLIAEAVGRRDLTHSEGRTMAGAVREWIRAEDTRLRAEDLQELRDQVAELRRRGMRPA